MSRRGASSAAAKSTNCCPSRRFCGRTGSGARAGCAGRVIKVETLGGVTYEKPVCHARVHICEVDRLPWIIARLPDDIIYRLRDELIWAIEHPIPIPNPPDPPFKFDPGFIDPVAGVCASGQPLRQVRCVGVMLNPQPLPPAELRTQAVLRAANVDAVMLNPQPLPPKAATLTFETRAALTAASTAIVREALIANVELIRIYWCYWDWLVAVVPLRLRRTGRDRNRREWPLRHDDPVSVLRRPSPICTSGSSIRSAKSGRRCITRRSAATPIGTMSAARR